MENKNLFYFIITDFKGRLDRIFKVINHRVLHSNHF